jgi:hypothetical protein
MNSARKDKNTKWHYSHSNLDVNTQLVNTQNFVSIFFGIYKFEL